MSETYVVTVIKYLHGDRYAIDNAQVLGQVDLVCENWTTDPVERRKTIHAADELFYVIASALVGYPVERNLIYKKSSDPVVYYGEYNVIDDAENASYTVNIFRHHFCEQVFDRQGYPDRV